MSMESSHLVIFSTSGKFITKFNVLRCIDLSETLFWIGARGRYQSLYFTLFFFVIKEKSQQSAIMYQSIPSLTIPPGQFF